jgi:outer membrane biosynthesis protein TonB
VQEEESIIDYRAALMAAVLSLSLHLLLLWLLPPTFKNVILLIPRARPVEVLVKPIPVPEHRLPPKLRYAETSSSANKVAPDETPLVSSRNQTAAQPVPEVNPQTSVLPKMNGDSDNIHIVQAMPRPVDYSEANPSVGQPGTSSAAVGPLPGKMPDPVVPKPQAENNPTPPANPDRPKATVVTGTTGLLLRNAVGVNRAGSLAVSARFSNYGDYMQRMMEAIQSSWWSIVERSRFATVSRGSVVVRFTLRRDGTVVDAEILESDVPLVMALACKDSVMAPAPYDAWRPDMVALFGDSDVVTIHFHYY